MCSVLIYLYSSFKITQIKWLWLHATDFWYGSWINLSFGLYWQTSSSQVMSSHWPSHLLKSSGEAVGQLNKSGRSASTEHRALDNRSLIKWMWRQVGVAANEGCRHGKLHGKVLAVMWGKGWAKLKKTPNKMCFDGGPLFVLSWPLCPAFITASGGKQMGHNKSLTIKRRVWN